jgi:hypothetical protein
MSDLKEFVRKHLQQHAKSQQWRHMDGTDTSFTIGYNGKHTGLVGVVHVREKTRLLCVSVSNGVKAPPPRMSAAYELVCRLNLGMALGAYWIDPDDGEVTFSITSSLLTLEPSDQWLGSIIHTALSTYDRYFPAISDVFYAGKAPADAVAEATGPSDKVIAQTLERLFSTAEGEQQPSERSRDAVAENGNAADNEPRKRRSKPRVDAKITPADIEEVLGEQRQQRRRRARKSGDDDTQ